MAKKISPETFSSIRNCLNDLREAGKEYPCNIASLTKCVTAQTDIKEAEAIAAIKKDSSLVICDNMVAFAGDEEALYAHSDLPILSLLKEKGPLGSKQIQDALSDHKQKMKEKLNRLIEQKSIVFFGKKYRIPEETKPISADKLISYIESKGSATFTALQKEFKADKAVLTQKLDELTSQGKLSKVGAKSPTYKIPPSPFDLINLVSASKTKGKYPVKLSDLKKESTKLKVSAKELSDLLADLCRSGSLQEVKVSTAKAYMLAGDDIRYAAKLTEALRFEMLSEIESLKMQLQEAALTSGVAKIGVESERDVEKIDQRVLNVIDSILNEKKRSRVIELSQLRRELADVSQETLDNILLQLGKERVLELIPVQDSVSLSQDQKAGLLKAPGGELVMSVAKMSGGR